MKTNSTVVRTHMIWLAGMALGFAIATRNKTKRANQTNQLSDDMSIKRRNIASSGEKEKTFIDKFDAV